MVCDSDSDKPTEMRDIPKIEDINMKDVDNIRVYLEFLDYDINLCTIDLDKYYDRLVQMKKGLENQKIQ